MSAHAEVDAPWEPRGTDLTWSLLRAITAASAAITVAVVVVALLAGGDVRLVGSFILAAGIDIGTLAFVLHAARERFDQAPKPEDTSAAAISHSGQALSAFVAVRLLIKAFLLVAAALLPWLSLIGAALGVLLTDTVMLTVGTALAATRTMRRAPAGRHGPTAIRARR